jgi:hypothetical protein
VSRGGGGPASVWWCGAATGHLGREWPVGQAGDAGGAAEAAVRPDGHIAAVWLGHAAVVAVSMTHVRMLNCTSKKAQQTGNQQYR